ncbi:MAG TPA: MCE family protein [Nocardioides sp.]
MNKSLSALLAAVLVLLGLSGCSLVGDDKMEITVELADSSGLFIGNDVGVLGVPVGEVTAIDPVGDHVRITLEVDADVKVPAKAGAVVVSRSMATDRYVELTPVYSKGPTMKDGAVITPEMTRTPVEWDQVLAAVDKLAEGLNGEGKDGKSLKRLLDSTSGSLDGNGAEIRRTIENLVGGTEAFSSNSGEFQKTVKNLESLTAAIAANDKLGREFIKRVADTTDLVKAERLNIETSVDSIARTIKLLGIFVTHHRDDLSAAATNVEDISTRIMKHDGSLDEFLRVMPVAMESLGMAINDRRRLDIKLPPTMMFPGSDLLKAICGLLPPVVCEELGTSPDLGRILDELLGGRTP